ncbi:unnamed protein product [Meganyctiphanes norvegica]|uniref:Class II aldolase/adducin N-terminal domain-containing protein n=1 Tax=Meganyctiphanes norvegica TaxID=48144 RepID=A0AAV2QJ37_MEGNR
MRGLRHLMKNCIHQSQRSSIIQTVRFFTSDSAKPYSLPNNAWGRNRACRLELACAYRGLDKLELNEGVCNHLTAMAPAADGQGEVMLVFPYGQHWSEVQASSILGVDSNGSTVEGEGRPETTAACIHLGIRKVNPDAKIIMHTHQPWATAMGCLEDPSMKMVHQNSTRFFQRVAYDTSYSGLANAIEEGERLGHLLGDKDMLVMGNHGVLAVAKTIAMAFDHLYFFERAAQVQMLAMSTGEKVRLISKEQSESGCKTFWEDLQMYADVHFYSMYRRLRNISPDFEL